MAGEPAADAAPVADEPIDAPVADAPAADAPAPDADAPADGDAPADADATAEPDWRALANPNGDKDLAKMLKRFGSPAGLARALADTKTQLSKKEAAALADLPEDATDEQRAEWRKSRGVPEAPENYDTSIQGVDWTDDDKAVLGEFTKAAHRLNVPSSAAKGLVQWYADTQIAAEQEREVNANKLQKQTEQALKTEYGADYGRNVSMMKEFGVSQLGQEGWDALVGARFLDGTRLGDNPAFMRLIVDAAMDRGDGLPFEAGGMSGGLSDADFIKQHTALSAKAAGSGADAQEARKKMNDPEYQKSVEAAYERQQRREEAGRRAA